MTNSKIILTILFLTSITLGGCSNTFDGAGRDIQGAGEWMQDTF